MQRIAWFTPLTLGSDGPPSGNLELITRLCQHQAVDIFTDTVPTVLSDDAFNVFSAYDFVWKHTLRPYDFTIYEIADTPRHGFVWPYLVRYPGLVVLHDDRLHRLRGGALRELRRPTEYRAEFLYCHPDADPIVPELGLAGLLGAAADIWPMRRIVLECSRLVVVDNRWRAEMLQHEASHDRFRVIQPGVSKPVIAADERTALRAAHGISAESVVCASFGRIGPQRRITSILEAVSALGETTLHILACGQVDNGYDPCREAEMLGVADRFTLVSDADDQQWLHYLAVADAALCLQWPDSSEVIKPWLHCLAYGLPTVVTDRADFVNIPTLDPRNWQVQCVRSLGQDSTTLPPEPAIVSIDIVDELHSLRIALRRMAENPQFRAQLAASSVTLWRNQFSLDQMVKGYLDAIQEARTVPSMETRPNDLPPHLLEDGTTHVRSLLGSLGVKYAL